jgi:hypothetical protein
MTLRDEFEGAIKRPSGVFWNKYAEEYDGTQSYYVPLAEAYQGQWEAYQAAHASQRKRIDELRDAIDDPVASVTGYHGGHCVIEPLDRARLLPVGMALYSSPQAAVPEGMSLFDNYAIRAAIECMESMKEHCPIEQRIFTNSTIKLLDNISEAHKERTE